MFLETRHTRAGRSRPRKSPKDADSRKVGEIEGGGERTSSTPVGSPAPSPVPVPDGAPRRCSDDGRKHGEACRHVSDARRGTGVPPTRRVVKHPSPLTRGQVSKDYDLLNEKPEFRACTLERTSALTLSPTPLWTTRTATPSLFVFTSPQGPPQALDFGDKGRSPALFPSTSPPNLPRWRHQRVAALSERAGGAWRPPSSSVSGARRRSAACGTRCRRARPRRRAGRCEEWRGRLSPKCRAGLHGWLKRTRI